MGRHDRREGPQEQSHAEMLTNVATDKALRSRKPA